MPQGIRNDGRPQQHRYQLTFPDGTAEWWEAPTAFEAVQTYRIAFPESPEPSEVRNAGYKLLRERIWKQTPKWRINR